MIEALQDPLSNFPKSEEGTKSVIILVESRSGFSSVEYPGIPERPASIQ